MKQITFVKTPLGIGKLEGNEKGITQFQILDINEPTTEVIPEVLHDAVFQLNEYFEGKRHTFMLKLNPQGTNFQKKVWKALADIPYGKTYSYKQLSIILGNPKAVRAVAAANAKNPLWIFVPCHRVIGSNGSLTGYAGGLQLKKWLLAHENSIKQQSLF